ncbi:MAG: mitochondrial fission ELM1 family protein [Alphaproteobacteria bacterium]
MSETAATCWVLSEGHAGMENQCRGLAEAAGFRPEVKRIRPRAPWTWLPPGWWPAPFRALGEASDSLQPPWPDLLITCGRRSVPYAMAIRRRSAGKTFTVHIQDPHVAPSRFDLLAPPRHDGLEGENIYPTTGALHRVTAERLAEEAETWAPKVAHLSRPYVTVLIGGSNGSYRIDADEIDDWCRRLAAIAVREGASLLVTPSRRTGDDNVVRLIAGLADVPAQVWDLQGENPYFGYLGLADHVVVSPDSISMVSEACATGKPVHVLPLAGGTRKFQAFHRNMREAGYTRLLGEGLESWTYPPLDDTADVAREIVRRLRMRSPS